MFRTTDTFLSCAFVVWLFLSSCLGTPTLRSLSSTTTHNYRRLRSDYGPWREMGVAGLPEYEMEDRRAPREPSY